MECELALYMIKRSIGFISINALMGFIDNKHVPVDHADFPEFIVSVTAEVF